jgi:hypothetical protein
MKIQYCPHHPNRKMAFSKTKYICFECIGQIKHKKDISSGKIKMKLSKPPKEVSIRKISKVYQKLYSS